MTRSKTSSHERSLPLRIVLGVYRFCASPRVAVVLIAVTTALLIWATFVYNADGEKASRFGIYGTWWFNTLGALLALNILCATLIRFPWRRRQTGFVVTHVGLLVLLLGCAVTRWYGVEATLTIYETRCTSRATMPSQHFRLTIVPENDAKVDKADGQNSGGQQKPKPELIEIPFVAGPYNWDDYKARFWFPWRLAHRDRGVLYDKDGIKLEVLDYYSHSHLVSVPLIELDFDVPPDAMRGHGQFGEDRTSLTLSVSSGDDPHIRVTKWGMGQRRSLPTGQRVVFFMTGDQRETEAFRDSRPEGPLGKLGQVVLHVRGKKYQLDVEKLTAGRLPLGDSGMEVELVRFDPSFLGVRLLIHTADQQPGRMVLFADMPEFNRHAYELPAFGSYWFDSGQKPEEGEQPSAKAWQEAALPRIDILQGADQKLYMRTWHSPKVQQIEALADDGEEKVAFENTRYEVTFLVEDFISAEKPGFVPKPLPFDKKRSDQGTERHRARVRLSLDGNSKEFWLEGIQPDPLERAVSDQQRKVLQGKGRSVVITMPRDEVDLGFSVHLTKFTRKLDPGTSQPSHYSSLVDFLAVDSQGHEQEEAKKLQENVLISLNAPVDFSDPRGGPSYRLFQASFNGPHEPGDPIFEEVVGDDLGRNRLFLSSLSVNHDPGRGLKYAGCLLVVLGIFIMYYMRAYFFASKTAPSKDKQG